jgi:integrase
MRNAAPDRTGQAAIRMVGTLPVTSFRHGESVKTVQARLGHANAAETLDTYSHLWPESDDRTREAVDLVLTGFLADSLRTSDLAER